MLDVKDQTMKKGILAGVISSVLVMIFVQPIFNILSPTILNFISISYARLADAIYMGAAKGIHYTTISSFTVFIISGLVSILIATVADLLIGRKTAKQSPSDKQLTTLSRLLAVLPLCLIITIPILFAHVLYDDMTIGLNLSFQQRLLTIAPYIPGKDEQILKAKWASMRSRADYNALNLSMDDYAKKNAITLPKAF